MRKERPYPVRINSTGLTKRRLGAHARDNLTHPTQVKGGCKRNENKHKYYKETLAVEA